MLKNKNYIHLAFAFDQNFISPFYVLLTSLFINNKTHKFYFHVVAIGVEETEMHSITTFAKLNNGEIKFYNIDGSTVANFVIPENSHFSLSTYYRLFLPALLDEEIETVLYLDTDLVILGDLLELYSTPTFYPVAAVLDPIEKKRPELGIYQENSCFNAGVLLINLKEWKRQEISEKAIKFLKDFPEKIKWVDQDALNAVLINNWEKLPEKYNITFYHIPKYIKRKDLQNFVKGKTIVHYTTRTKPWQISCTNRLRYLYLDYLKKSPYPINEPKEKHNSKDWYSLIKRTFKEFLIDHTSIFPSNTGKII